MLKNTMDISALESFFPDEVEEYKKLEKELKKITQVNKEKHASRIAEIKRKLLEDKKPINPST